MKMNKLIFPMMIALVAMVATTGCRKGQVKTTMIPGHEQPAITDNSGSGTVPPGNVLPGGDQPFANPGGDKVMVGGGPTPTSWKIEDVTQDRAALAAYTVHFAFDSAAVTSREESKVVIVSEALKSDMSAKLIIEGHCDERGTEEYNRALGERRALALREELAKAGIDPERIQTISFGKDKPVDDGHDDAAFAKNRRGEFILCHLKTNL